MLDRASLEALTLPAIGLVYLDRADPARARPYLEQAVATARVTGPSANYAISRY